jgi:hypothetical protein
MLEMGNFVNIQEKTNGGSNRDNFKLGTNANAYLNNNSSLLSMNQHNNPSQFQQSKTHNNSLSY